MFNEKARKAYLAYINKFDAWSKKYGVKVVGSWTVQSEHLAVIVLEAPSMEAFQKLSMAPEVLALSAYETSEIKLALSMKEAMKMLSEAK